MDEKARDIYRIAVLVVSIIVAAAAINFDVTDVIQSVLYDFGVILSTDESSILGNLITRFGFWAFVPALLFILFIVSLFSITLIVVIWLFFVPPYYAVRAQASAPISANQSTWELIIEDIKMFINTYISDRYIPQRWQSDVPDSIQNKIISDVEKEFEEFYSFEGLISHNRDILSNKSENLIRAKKATQRFFISIILFSAVVIFMIYV